MDPLLIEEIDVYTNQHYSFLDFIDLQLEDNELKLICISKKKAVPEKDFVPVYNFEIYKQNHRIGKINLRIGYNEGLFYVGNIGYMIDEAKRGNHYAAKACKLLIPLLHAHDMKSVIITNEKDNTASRKTCEYIDAQLVAVIPLPTWTPLYKEGQRYVSVYKWLI